MNLNLQITKLATVSLPYSRFPAAPDVLCSARILFAVPHVVMTWLTFRASLTFAGGSGGYLSVYIGITANLASVNLGTV